MMVKNNAWNFDTTYTIGDLLYASSTSQLSKLGVGNSSEFLTVSSGLPVWGTVSPSSTDSQTFSLFSDFDLSKQVDGGVSNQPADQNGASAEISGTEFINDTTGDTEHPGIAYATTGSSSSGYGYVTSFGNRTKSTPGVVLGSGTYDLTIFAKVDTLSTSSQRYTAFIGFSDKRPSVAGTPNGCWFEYVDNVNSGNWQIKTATSSTTTTANTSTAVDTNWHKFKVSVNAAATSVSFYIDDVEVANSPITTNIPTADIVYCVVIIKKSAGATPRSILVDYMQLDIALTSPRS
jgi:hypothetical protein